MNYLKSLFEFLVPQKFPAGKSEYLLKKDRPNFFLQEQKFRYCNTVNCVSLLANNSVSSRI